MAITKSFRSSRGGREAPPPKSIAIDGYRIDELAGVGPLTAVYRGVLESHQQQVVLKVLHASLASNELLVQRFLQAANAARLVTHDRVLPCYDVGQSNGWVYLACEHFEGRTLAEMSGNGAMDRQRAVYLAWQAAMGIEAIHAVGLVHGNVRPSNVLVDTEDGVRLADHCLPPAVHADDAMAPPSALYLPPEALVGDAAPTQAGDIFALGLLLATMLGAKLPGDGRILRHVREHRCAPGSEPITSLRAALPDAEIAAVLARACAQDPAARYDAIWRMREDLERLQYGMSPMHAGTMDQGGATRHSASGTVPRPGAEARPARTAYGRWLTLGAVLAVLAIGAAMLMSDTAYDRSPPPSIAASGTPALASPQASPPLPVEDPAPARAIEAASATRDAIASWRPAWAGAAGEDRYGRWIDLVVGSSSYRMRRVAPGSFWMGSPADEPGRNADEERHLVSITRAYWIGETEVDQTFYEAVTGANPSRHRGATLPVDSVSWHAALDCLASLGARIGAPVRLPTEAEWELACRAGADRSGIPGSGQARTAADALAGPADVRTTAANAFGIYDMQGNVLEWTTDTYGRYHREAAQDPLASGGVHRVLRGGSWNLPAAEARPAARSKALPVAALFHVGFRVAASE